MDISSYKTRLIGRDAELKFLKDKLLQGKVHLLQVFGQPCVGKSELVWEVLRIMQHELKNESFNCKSIIVQENDSWDTIHSKIIHFKNQNPIPSRALIVLKDFHLINPDILLNFKEFCCQASLDGMLSIIIIHQGLTEFDIKGVISEKIPVPPLDEFNAKILFCEYAFDSSSSFGTEGQDEYIDYLVDQCSGLPGLIKNLAYKWKEWSSYSSLKEFCDFFRKNGSVFKFMKNVVCPQLGITKSFNLFFKCIPENFKKALAELSVCPGPLSIDEMTYLLEDSNELKTKFEVALPLVTHGFLKKNKEKFKVKPLIRDLANQQLFHMYDEDVNRLKFVNLIGNVLLKAEESFQKNLPKQTLGIVKDNWDNIEYLLRQGIHLKSDGKTISVLFQVAEEAGDVISACCPREAKEFFGDCLNAAEKVGLPAQKAMMQYRYGQSLTNEGGAGGERDGMEQYHKAITGLKQVGKDFRTLYLLNSMAYNYHRQGRLLNARKCAKEALEMEVRDEDPEVVNHVKINSASIYAYTLTDLGHSKEAKDFLLETLDCIDDSNHASISVILNSLGEAEEGPNGDEAEALKWYSRSLSVRRRMCIIKPENLVIPLCHIADLASKKLQKYDLALKYLNEATEIMKKKCWIHIHSALIQQTFGIVHLRMKSIDDALSYFKDALKIHLELHPKHYFNAVTLNWISHCYLLKDDFTLAAKKFEETRKMMVELIEMRPNVDYLAQPLEHLVRMTFRNQERNVSYQNQLINELQRLVDLPELDKTLLSKYKKILEVYKECKNGRKCVLEKLPMTCTVCDEITVHGICPLTQYKEKVNMVSYTDNLLTKTKPISCSNKCQRPPKIKFFSNVPCPQSTVAESPSPSSEDPGSRLWSDEFVGDSSSWTKDKTSSLYKNSSTYSKSYSKVLTCSTLSDCKSKLTNETKLFSNLSNFHNRQPIQSVEHSDESNSMTIQKLPMDENPEIDRNRNIENIIFEDQYRQYESVSSPNNSNSKKSDSHSEVHPWDCDTKMMKSSSSGPTGFYLDRYSRNMIAGTNESSKQNLLSFGHFKNQEDAFNQAQNTQNNFSGVHHNRPHEISDTVFKGYLTGQAAALNHCTQFATLSNRIKQNNTEDYTKLSHLLSPTMSPHRLKGSQIKPTGEGFFFAQQYGTTNQQQSLDENFEQNSVSKNLNIPDLDQLLLNGTDSLKSYDSNHDDTS